MTNLEKLGLYIAFILRQGFFDGTDLKRNILDRIRQLNQFTFDIRSRMHMESETNLPSKEDIQYTLRDFRDHETFSYIDYFPEMKEGQCRIYSASRTATFFHAITNNFPGGFFPYVREVSLHDQRPFEHHFFLRIAQVFPLVELLCLVNRQSQNHKESSQSTNDDRNHSIIKYNSLIDVHIVNGHDDYLEEFLLNSRTDFQNDIRLDVDYETLQRVTNNFTRHDTRINSRKINQLYLFHTLQFSKSIEEYFPSAKISCA